jgi:hypothetical protein
MKNGYDGLANPGQECGCGFSDFTPCEYIHLEECEPAYRDDERGGWFTDKPPKGEVK